MNPIYLLQTRQEVDAENTPAISTREGRNKRKIVKTLGIEAQKKGDSTIRGFMPARKPDPPHCSGKRP